MSFRVAGSKDSGDIVSHDAWGILCGFSGECPYLVAWVRVRHEFDIDSTRLVGAISTRS